MQITYDDAELAIQYVEKWLRKEHHYVGEIAGLDVVLRGKYIDVMLLQPYGLFIIEPDGFIEDNYEVFGKR